MVDQKLIVLIIALVVTFLLLRRCTCFDKYAPGEDKSTCKCKGKELIPCKQGNRCHYKYSKECGGDFSTTCANIFSVDDCNYAGC